MIEDNLALPFDTEVLGVPVTVELRLVLRPDASRCDSEGCENADLFRERATGVEPATSSLGSFPGPCGARVFRRR